MIPNLAAGFLNQKSAARAQAAEYARQRRYSSDEAEKAAWRNVGMSLLGAGLNIGGDIAGTAYRDHLAKPERLADKGALNLGNEDAAHEAFARVRDQASFGGESETGFGRRDIDMGGTPAAGPVTVPPPVAAKPDARPSAREGYMPPAVPPTVAAEAVRVTPFPKPEMAEGFRQDMRDLSSYGPAPATRRPMAEAAASPRPIRPSAPTSGREMRPGAEPSMPQLLPAQVARIERDAAYRGLSAEDRGLQEYSDRVKAGQVAGLGSKEAEAEARARELQIKAATADSTIAKNTAQADKFNAEAEKLRRVTQPGTREHENARMEAWKLANEAAQETQRRSQGGISLGAGVSQSGGSNQPRALLFAVDDGTGWPALVGPDGQGQFKRGDVHYQPRYDRKLGGWMLLEQREEPGPDGKLRRVTVGPAQSGYRPQPSGGTQGGGAPRGAPAAPPPALTPASGPALPATIDEARARLGDLRQQKEALLAKRDLRGAEPVLAEIRLLEKHAQDLDRAGSDKRRADDDVERDRLRREGAGRSFNDRLRRFADETARVKPATTEEAKKHVLDKLGLAINGGTVMGPGGARLNEADMIAALRGGAPSATAQKRPQNLELFKRIAAAGREFIDGDSASDQAELRRLYKTGRSDLESFYRELGEEAPLEQLLERRGFKPDPTYWGTQPPGPGQDAPPQPRGAEEESRTQSAADPLEQLRDEVEAMRLPAVQKARIFRSLARQRGLA